MKSGRGSFLCFGAVSAACLLSLAGCSGSGGGADTGTLGDATIVADSPTATTPWSSLEGKTNINAVIRGAESGYTVYQRPVKIVSAYSLGGIDTFAIVAPSSDAYGPGYSGSPILVNGNIVGAVFAGDDPTHLYGISITQEMTTGQAGRARPATTTTAAPDSWAPKEWYFEGPSSMMSFVSKKKDLGQANYVGLPSAKAPQAVGPGPKTPIPGSRYDAAILYGPEAYLYVGGTYTLKLPSGQWVATGHPIEEQGPVQWPIFSAYTDFIENVGTVETHPAGSPFGTLTFDGLYGSLIDLTKVPTVMPVSVNMQLNGTNLAPVTHYAVMDRGSSFEYEADDIGALTPVVDATYDLPDLITGAGSITIFTGKTSTTTQFNFQATQESPSTFAADYETNVDVALLTVYANNPAAQITNVEVSLQMVTSPVGNPARKKN